MRANCLLHPMAFSLRATLDTPTVKQPNLLHPFLGATHRRARPLNRLVLDQHQAFGGHSKPCGENLARSAMRCVKRICLLVCRLSSDARRDFATGTGVS